MSTWTPAYIAMVIRTPKYRDNDYLIFRMAQSLVRNETIRYREDASFLASAVYRAKQRPNPSPNDIAHGTSLEEQRKGKFSPLEMTGVRDILAGYTAELAIIAQYNEAAAKGEFMPVHLV